MRLVQCRISDFDHCIALPYPNHVGSFPAACVYVYTFYNISNKAIIITLLQQSGEKEAEIMVSYNLISSKKKLWRFWTFWTYGE